MIPNNQFGVHKRKVVGGACEERAAHPRGPGARPDWCEINPRTNFNFGLYGGETHLAAIIP